MASFLATSSNLTDEVLRAAEEFVQYTIANNPLPNDLVRVPSVADGVSIQELRDIPDLVDLARKGELRIPDVTSTPTPTPATSERAAIQFPVPGTSGQLPSYEWEKDGITQYERAVLGVIELLNEWSADPSAVLTIARAPWMADGIDPYDLSALRQLYSLAPYDAVGGVILARFFATFENLEGYKFRASQDFLEGAHRNLPLHQGLLDLPWIGDGVTELELEVVISISRLASQDSAFAERLMGVSWVNDEVSRSEAEAIVIFSGLLSMDAELTNRLLNLGWVADGISGVESSAIGFLQSKMALDLNSSVAGGEFRTSRKKPIASAIKAMEPTLELDELLFNSVVVGYMLSLLPNVLSPVPPLGEEQLRHLASQAWFQDGLTEDERALIIALRTVAADPDMEELFQELVESPEIRSERISSPSGVEVALFAVSRSTTPQQRDMFDAQETGIEAIEDIMNIPWHQPNVVVLLEPDHTDRKYATGFFLSPFVIVLKSYSKGLTYHELGHFYFNRQMSPSWLSEGAAEFLRWYSFHRDENLSAQSGYNRARDSVNSRCAPRGVTNIQEWIEVNSRESEEQLKESGFWFCQYALGETFLLALYQSLGRETMSDSLREIYVMTDDRKAPVTEYEIYEVFLSNTAPGKQDNFRDIYRQHHGGPIPGS